MGMIARHVAGAHRTGRDGSLVAVFGRGAPSTLVVTACDEPGLVVSGIGEEGYLRLDGRTAGQHGELARYFVGQHVRVSRRAGESLPGVIAAPSVHFSGSRGSARVAADDLYLDVGARSRQEARAAGFAVLDRVTLDKRVATLAGGWVSSPWVSTRAGAAVMLGLSRRLAGSDPEPGVALAFTVQQHAGNAGLTRVLNSMEVGTAVVLVPAARRALSVAPCSRGRPSEAFARRLADTGRSLGLRTEWRSSHPLAWDPFYRGEPWASIAECAIVAIPARNAGSPAEAVHPAELARLEELLARITGAPGPPGDAPADHPDSGGRGHSPSPGPFEALLRRLVAASGVSGDESAVRERIRALLPSHAAGGATVDARGNLVVRIGGDGPPAAAFIAHMDEIGLGVQSVRPDGRLAVAAVGGGIQRLFAGHPAVIRGARGPVHAVMATERSVDIGADSAGEAEAAGVAPDATATVFKRFRRLIGGRVSARSLDDRLGCAALLEALGRLRRAAARAARPVDFVFSVSEETGLEGARHYAGAWTPGRVYAVDTFVTSDSPVESRRTAFARLGNGAVVRAVDESGLVPRGEVERVLRIARRNGIPLQSGVTAGGNDGSVFRSLDSVSIPIGFPLRYAHTPVETADLADAAAVADLVEALAREALAGR